MIKLEEIVSLGFLQRLQDSFAEATGLAAITVDYQGNPLLQYSAFSPFCAYMRENPDFYKRCVRSDAYASLEAVRNGTVCIHKCHAGLIDFAIPIIVDDEYVASMMCGQLKTDSALDGVEIDLVSQGYDYLSDDPAIRRLYDERPVVPLSRIKAAADFFHMTIKYIVDQYLLNRKNTELTKKQKGKNRGERPARMPMDGFPYLQITPQFYFSALNTASVQAYVEGAEKTQEIICAISDISRFSTKYSGRAIPLRLELQNLENHLMICKLRLGENVSIGCAIQDNILDCAVPSMLLSEFVENSIMHGRAAKKGFRHIQVKGYMKARRLCFEIHDDGVMAEGAINFLNSGSADEGEDDTKWNGIRNLRKRLLFFSAMILIWFFHVLRAAMGKSWPCSRFQLNHRSSL
jgi:ligand-binding sensor protein